MTCHYENLWRAIVLDKILHVNLQKWPIQYKNNVRTQYTLIQSQIELLIKLYGLLFIFQELTQSASKNNVFQTYVVECQLTF